MAKSNKKEVILNMVYSLGASVVILGALCKINHLTPLGVSGSAVLAVGLIVEAFIFVVFAFDPPKPEYEWEKAYPELADGEAAAPRKSKAPAEAKLIKEAEVSLSTKLDKMLADAKLDATLFDRLRGGIENFSHAVNDINKTVDANAATQKYSDQMSLAANHMESLNALYQIQLESGKKHMEINQKFVDDLAQAGKDSATFQQQLSELTVNLNNLNKVYGGMLSAMKA